MIYFRRDDEIISILPFRPRVPQAEKRSVSLSLSFSRDDESGRGRSISFGFTRNLYPDSLFTVSDDSGSILKSYELRGLK